MVELALLLFNKELPNRNYFYCGIPGDILVCIV